MTHWPSSASILTHSITCSTGADDMHGCPGDAVCLSLLGFRPSSDTLPFLCKHPCPPIR